MTHRKQGNGHPRNCAQKRGRTGLVYQIHTVSVGLVLFRLKEYLPHGAFSLEDGERGFQSEIGDRISDNFGVNFFCLFVFMVYIFLSYNSLLLPISLACFFSEEEQSLGGIENLKKKKIKN